MPHSGDSAVDCRALVIRWVNGVWNERCEDLIDEMLDPECIIEVEGADGPLTRDTFRAYRRAFLNAVPDLHVEILSVVTEGQRAVQSWRARGTHLGAGLGIPPSGRPVDLIGLTSYEFRGQRIVRGADRWNRGEMIASLMQVRIDELRSSVRLTQREAQVALMMAERLTHVEIAGQLGIRPNTARRHCEHVLAKLDVGRRQDVAAALGRIPGSVLARQGEDL